MDFKRDNGKWEIYAWERKTFPDIHNQTYGSIFDVKLIVDKLCKEFNFPVIDVKQAQKNANGSSYKRLFNYDDTLDSQYIEFIPKHFNNRVIAHEVAHYFTAYNNNMQGSGHGYKFRVWYKKILLHMGEKREIVDSMPMRYY